MAAFTYQHSPFHLDSLYLPITPIKMSDLLEGEEEVDTKKPTSFPFSSSDLLHQQEIPNPTDVKIHENDHYNEPSAETDQKVAITDQSSSTIVDIDSGDQVSQEEPPMEKKRKSRDGSCLSSSAQSKDPKKSKSKRQKKCSEDTIEAVANEEKKSSRTNNKKNQRKNHHHGEEPPTGYVHVRARRGEATDSHSLAERVRREKISERLKQLQGLVPGCDKVTSKALMLDEIINYVQSLQIQVEVLSMKLASLNPTVYDFGVDLDDFMVKSESMEEEAINLPNPLRDVADITATPSTANNIPIIDCPLQQEQRLNDFTQPQENGDQLWHVGYQRQMFINQPWATTNLFSSY